MLIGLLGQKGVGKDTFFQIFSLIKYYKEFKLNTDVVEFVLKNLNNYKYYIYLLQSMKKISIKNFSFADKLKEILSDITNTSKIDFDDPVLKKLSISEQYPQTRRKAMQGIGNAFREHVDQNIWIDYLSKELDNKPAEYQFITDVRMPNEADFIKSKGGTVIKIIRDFNQPVDYHPSEALVDSCNYDLFIENNLNMTEYIYNIEVLIDKFFNKI